MDDDTICHHLEQLATHLDVTVRYEPSAGKAGYCLLNGAPTIFIDQRMTLRQRAAALARMLCRHDCEDVFLPPVVRSLIDECREVEGLGRPGTGEAARSAGAAAAST